jgi:hypothetical protein
VRDPVKKPECVLEYLARYTHRVAIANSRIKALEDGMVTFTFNNRKREKTETLTVTAVEFIRRFLLHSLPKSFGEPGSHPAIDGLNRSYRQRCGDCRVNDAATHGHGHYGMPLLQKRENAAA